MSRFGFINFYVVRVPSSQCDTPFELDDDHGSPSVHEVRPNTPTNWPMTMETFTECFFQAVGPFMHDICRNMVARAAHEGTSTEPKRPWSR